MTAFKLEKDVKFNLTKDSDGLRAVRIELDWDTPSNVFPRYDLDVSAFGLSHTPIGPKLVSDDYFIYYNHASKDKVNDGIITTNDGAITKSPDETSGGVEWIAADLGKIDSRVDELSIIITIHDAVKRRQHFGNVTNATVVVKDALSNEPICFYELANEFSTQTAIQVGSLVRIGNDWGFEAMGVGYQYGLGDFIAAYE